MSQGYYKTTAFHRLILKSYKAFSLIEILVVLLIVAFIFTLTAKRFTRKEQRVKTVFEKLSRLNRRLSTLSKLHGRTYRWVIQLNNEEPDQYWVEKKQAVKTGQLSMDIVKGPVHLPEEEGKKEDSDFALDDSFYAEPEVIPPLLDITSLESSVWDKDKTEGLAYIYYYPKGLAQETAIQFFRPDNQGRWTLYLDPVTKELITLKEEKSLAPAGGIQ